MDLSYPVHLIRCPHCRKALYLPKMEGFNQITCPKCMSEYSFQEYSFLDKSIEEKGEDTYLYRLRIRSEDGTEAISFRSKDPKLSFFQQDQLLVLRTTKSVAFLKNLTEGWTEYVHDSETSQVMAIGAVSMLIGAAGYMLVSWWGFVAAPIAGGIFYWYRNRRIKLRRVAMAEQLQDAKAIQEQLSCVAHDNERFSITNEKIRDASFSLTRFQQIREQQCNLALPKQHINVLDRGIRRLQESLDVMHGIQGKYEQRLNQTWLGIEIRNLTAMMPDSIIEYRLQSQEMEAQLQAELDAIAEVKALFAQYEVS